ncbi:MAG: hypothetical protein ACK5MK_02865 [Dysgonomonas sp.]
MKKLVFLLSFTFVFMLNVQGQDNKKFDIERFKKERIDFLIKEIGLTNQESKVFIPLCDELMSKKFELNREIRRKGREVRQKGARATAADYESLNDQTMDNKIKEAQLDKEYYQKFKTVLSPEKIYKYQRAESKFMRRTVNNSEKK